MEWSAQCSRSTRKGWWKPLMNIKTIYPTWIGIHSLVPRPLTSLGMSWGIHNQPCVQRLYLPAPSLWYCLPSVAVPGTSSCETQCQLLLQLCRQVLLVMKLPVLEHTNLSMEAIVAGMPEENSRKSVLTTF